MTPNATTTAAEPPVAPETEPDADLHPEVQSVIAATERLPVHDEGSDALSFETQSGTVSVSLPEGTTSAEVAAIAVAVSARLREERAPDERDETGRGPKPEYARNRWRRSTRLDHRSARVRGSFAPSDDWKLAGRCEARRP
jgi:hypothetical protein